MPGPLNANYASLASEVVDVKRDFQALGDGVTDDTAPIQNAINAAATNFGGGTVYFPPGVYNVTATLTITKSGVSLVGAGAGASVIRTPAGKEAITILLVGDNVNTCADVKVTELQINSQNQKTANSAIKLQKCFRTWLQRLRLQNQYRGIHVFNSTQTWLEDSDIRDTSENAVTFESTIGNGYDLYLTNVVADNPVVTNNGVGLNWLGGENLVIHNCDFLHFVTGFSVAPPAGKQTRFGYFSAAEFDTSSDNGIKLASTGDIVGLTFTQCWAGTSTNYGVLVDGSGGGLLQGVRFVGLKSFHNGLAGIRLTGGAKDVHLLGCDVIGNSQTLANARSGIEIASSMGSNWSIVGCKSGNGYQQGNTQDKGLNLDSGTYTNFLIADNDFSVNTNAALGLYGATGSGVIRNNLGYNPVGVLTPPAVPATTVAYTNTSGLDCTVFVTGGTVTVIAVNATSTGLTSGTFRVPAGQTIAITYTVAPTWVWIAD
jgi:hypothetical protein